jgi:hypothetical protein
MLSFSSLFYVKNIENKYVTRHIQIICKNKQSIIFLAVEFHSQDHSAIVPNSEQSSKGKVKTHKYINRQNQSTTGKL